MKWLPICELHEHVKGREMFVVRAFDIIAFEGAHPYTTDPYCVFIQLPDDFGNVFARWPHHFSPTHFCLLPVWEE